MTTLADLRRAIEESHCKAGNFGLTCPACALLSSGECWKPRVIAVLDTMEQNRQIEMEQLRSACIKIQNTNAWHRHIRGYELTELSEATAAIDLILHPAADTAPTEDASDSKR